MTSPIDMKMPDPPELSYEQMEKQYDKKPVDKAMSGGVATIKKNPKFKNAIKFTLNQLEKMVSREQSGTQCLENSYHFYGCIFYFFETKK